MSPYPLLDDPERLRRAQAFDGICELPTNSRAIAKLREVVIQSAHAQCMGVAERDLEDLETEIRHTLKRKLLLGPEVSRHMTFNLNRGFWRDMKLSSGVSYADALSDLLASIWASVELQGDALVPVDPSERALCPDVDASALELTGWPPRKRRPRR